MSYTLKERTLALVKEQREQRRLRELSEETGIPYFVIYNFVSFRSPVIDAETCQKLYTHLTGHTLEIR